MGTPGPKSRTDFHTLQAILPQKFEVRNKVNQRALYFPKCVSFLLSGFRVTLILFYTLIPHYIACKVNSGVPSILTVCYFFPMLLKERFDFLRILAVE